jgi:hypothetical protein
MTEHTRQVDSKNAARYSESPLSTQHQSEAQSKRWENSVLLNEQTKEVNECLAQDLETGTQNTFVTNVTKAVCLEHEMWELCEGCNRLWVKSLYV